MPYSDPEFKRNYHKAYMKKWYQQHKADHKKQVRKNAVLRAQARIEEFKTGKKCARCPETHPACLDFHHKNPDEKEIAISEAFHRWGRKRLIAELEKCEIICSNCHRKLHYELRAGNSIG